MNDLFAELGLRRVINGTGYATVLGASPVSDEVIAAVAGILTQNVEMIDLQRAASEAIHSAVDLLAAVIAWFAVRGGRRHTARDIFNYIVMPAIGMALTGLLWVNLDDHALVVGLIWTGLGLLYLIVLTRGFRRPIVSFDENQPVTGFNKIVEPGPRSQI